MGSDTVGPLFIEFDIGLLNRLVISVGGFDYLLRRFVTMFLTTVFFTTVFLTTVFLTTVFLTTVFLVTVFLVTACLIRTRRPVSPTRIRIMDGAERAIVRVSVGLGTTSPFDISRKILTPIYQK
jgi:hypothetical protein